MDLNSVYSIKCVKTKCQGPLVVIIKSTTIKQTYIVFLKGHSMGNKMSTESKDQIERLYKIDIKNNDRNWITYYPLIFKLF